MRILVVYQHAPTPGAPGIYRHHRLLTQLVRRGHHVEVVASPINYMSGTAPAKYRERRHRRELVDGVTYHWVRASGDIHRSLGRTALNYLTFAASAVLRGIRLRRPDLVWSSSPPLTVGTAGRMLARRFRVPHVFEVRDLWPESVAAAGALSERHPAYRVALRASKAYTRTAAAVIVPTPGLVDLVRGHGAGRVEVVTNAIDPHSVDPQTRAAMRAELDVADDEVLFAYVGAHGSPNGLDTLLDAMELMRDERGVRIVLAGDGLERVRLEERLRANPDPHVTMLGSIPKTEIPRLLGAADVGLHLLRPAAVYESALPTKMLEYMSAGLPCITTASGLPTQIARESGGDVAPVVAEGMADVLRAWAAMEPSERHRRGAEALRYGTERYGLAASTDRLERLLEDVLARRSATAAPG